LDAFDIAFEAASDTVFARDKALEAASDATPNFEVTSDDVAAAATLEVASEAALKASLAWDRALFAFDNALEVASEIAFAFEAASEAAWEATVALDRALEAASERVFALDIAFEAASEIVAHRE
jgi:hypothetical protein